VRSFNVSPSGGGVQVAPGVDFRQAEIEQLGLAVPGDENIGRLDVAVDDAFGMGSVECVGNLDAEFQHEVDGQRFAVDAVFEGLALEIFHGQKRAAIFFADVVDGADVGVVQGRGGTGFAAEPIQNGEMAADLIGQKLERNETAEARVLGFVDHAHSPAAQLFDDSIMGDAFAGHGPALA
jgi:hypothetical protein